MSRTPWRLALNDMTRPVTLLRNDVLAEATNDYKECIVSSNGHVHVYTLDVAINGAPGVLYCDKLNRKTSAGAPYKCPKKKFIFFKDEAESTDVDVTDEIKGEINRMITTYQRGERVHPVYCGHLKDEPVTFEKAEAGKTRVFTASGMAHTIVTRMYLLSVIVHMQTNRFVYEMGPGIIVQSLEWEEVRRHIARFGETRIIAGDYSKFDKRMPATVILAAFDIILTICEDSGYTQDELSVVRGIAYDTAYPVVDFHGDLIEFYGSNPSGHPLTVIVNGLANSLYMRYVYLILRPIGWKKKFNKCVSLMTYGDDNIMGVCSETPWFNHTAIQKVLADVDIGYTMADKEAESVPYISLDDANFLKRTWRYDADIGAYVAPLDRSSIAKMLTMCTIKANMSPQAHAIQVIGTAVREMFWYGKEEFEKHVAILKEVVDECQLGDYVMETTFPAWIYLHAAFWGNSEFVMHSTGRQQRRF
nr:nonstructural protein [Flumine marna-like virus 9]